MKKILTLALCLTAVGSMSAQKVNVEQAKKLSGKSDKLTEARALINQAVADPETANDVMTYYVGGKIEFDAYENAIKKRMINPNDESINPEEMAEQLMNGYKMYVKAMPLDQVPNAKGEVKPKYTKEMTKTLNSHFDDYFNAGGTFYNNKKYYPEAYEAFMVYGDMPAQEFAEKRVQAIGDSVRCTSYFNAGLSAYAGNSLPESAAAFKKARMIGSDNAQNYIYELACWQYMAQKDESLAEEAKNQIEEIALAGFNKFGMAQPIFLNNLVNSMVIENRFDDALKLINSEIEKNPSANLYGLRGFVYDRMEKDAESVADYRTVASFENADFESLKNACKKIFKTGTEKWNLIEGNSEQARADRKDVKENYFEAALNIANRAKTMNGNDSDLDYVIENITYALETYFPNSK
jgi:tetratricopeptide (TPR) repeat protein